MDNDGDLHHLIVSTADPSSSTAILRRRARTATGCVSDLARAPPTRTPSEHVSAALRRPAPMPLYGSAPTDLDVGLGSVDRTPKIEIWWLGSTKLQVLTDVAAESDSGPPRSGPRQLISRDEAGGWVPSYRPVTIGSSGWITSPIRKWSPIRDIK